MMPPEVDQIGAVPGYGNGVVHYDPVNKWLEVNNDPSVVANAILGSFYAVPKDNTRAGIQAAVDLIAAGPTGTGTIWLKDAVYDCTDGVPIALKSGINIMGPFCPVMIDLNQIPDSVFTFSAGARIVGNGQPVFVYNNVANTGPVANPLVCLRGATYRNIAFTGCSSGFAVGSYNNAGAVDCTFENILCAKTTGFGLDLQNLMHCTMKHLGFYSCAGMLRQINNIDMSVLQAGNNIIDDLFGVAAVTGDGYTPQSLRQRRGHVLGCAQGGVTGIPSQLQGVTNYGRIQANMFGRVEYTTGAAVTVTNTSSDFGVPELAEFPVGMQFQNVTAVGGLVANYVYTVLSRSGTSGAGTIKLGVSPSADAITANANGTTTFKSKGHAGLVVQGRGTSGAGISFFGVTFTGIDIEGIASAGIVMEYMGGVVITSISTLPATTDCYKQIVYEQCKGGPTIINGPAIATIQQGTSYGALFIGKFDWANASNYYNANNLKWPVFLGTDGNNDPVLNISANNRAGLPTFKDSYWSVTNGPVSGIAVGVPIGRYMQHSQTNNYSYLGGIGTLHLQDTANRSITYPAYTSAVHGMEQANYHGGAPANGAVITINQDAGHTIGAFGWTAVDLRPGQYLWTAYDHERTKHAILATNKLSFTDSSGTPGAATAHTQSGKCSVAAGATSVVITNALVHANAHVVVTAASNDATAVVKSVVPGAGSFTVNLTAPTAQTNLTWTLVQY